MYRKTKFTRYQLGGIENMLPQLLTGNNMGEGSVTTGIIAKPFVDKIEDPTTKAILTGLTQGAGGLLNLLNQNLDKKMQPNENLKDYINALSMQVMQSGNKFKQARERARALLGETELPKEQERLYYQGKGIDPTKIDFNKSISLDDYDYIFKGDKQAEALAIAFKRSYPDAPPQVVEGAVAGMLGDDMRYKFFEKYGNGNIEKGYDYYNQLINENKDKYDFEDMGTRNTPTKDARLTFQSENIRRTKFKPYPLQPTTEPEPSFEPERNIEKKEVPVKGNWTIDRKVDIPAGNLQKDISDEPNKEKGNEGTPLKEKETKVPFTPYQLKRQQNTLEGLIQGITGLRGLIAGNKAFRELQKLRFPFSYVNPLVRPEEKMETINLDRQREGQVQEMSKQLSRNTGNLQALMSGNQNLFKQSMDAKTKLDADIESDYRRRLAGEADKLANIAYENERTRNKEKQYLYEKAVQNLANSAERGRETFQNALQQTLNILRNNQANRMQHHRQIYQAMKLYDAGKKDYLERMKKSNPAYFYKLDGQGNPLRDSEGNFIPTTDKERKQMELQWSKEFAEGEGKEYANILRNVKNYGGKGFLGAYKRNTMELPEELANVFDEDEVNTSNSQTNTNRQNNSVNTNQNNLLNTRQSNLGNTNTQNNTGNTTNQVNVTNTNTSNVNTGNQNIFSNSILNRGNNILSNVYGITPEKLAELQRLMGVMGQVRNPVMQVSGQLFYGDEDDDMLGGVSEEQLALMKQGKKSSKESSKSKSVASGLVGNGYIDMVLNSIKRYNTDVAKRMTQFYSMLNNSSLRSVERARANIASLRLR